jgi:hypothetical protein
LLDQQATERLAGLVLFSRGRVELVLREEALGEQQIAQRG